MNFEVAIRVYTYNSIPRPNYQRFPAVRPFAEPPHLPQTPRYLAGRTDTLVGQEVKYPFHPSSDSVLS
ncbi:hypothetical protein WAI453_003730 [Rhynchosporium graminicola]